MRQDFMVALAAFLGFLLLAPSGSRAATDSLPQMPLVVAKVDAGKYEAARAGLKAEVQQFGVLAQKAEKGLTPALQSSMQASLKTIRSHAQAIQSLSQIANNDVGMKLAGQMLINDDITGKKAQIRAAASLLRDLETKLGLLEPVVHR